jgi:ATP-binding cassette, subfamily A (ABC1), member 1
MIQLKNFNRVIQDLLSNSSFSKSVCGPSNRNIFMIFEKLINASLKNTTKFSTNNDNHQKELDFCSTLKIQLNSTSEGKFVFNRISMFLNGKILYAPNKPIFNNIINRMNSTFVTIEYFWKLFDNLTILKQKFLEAEELFDYDFSVQNIEMLNNVLSFIKNALGCIDLDKFIGYENEETAVDAAINRIDNDTFWALIVFEDNSNNTILPNIVTYKIRQSAKESRNTFFTKTREYKYGPNNCIWCNVEFVNGFIYIQDLLEKSIIEERTNETYEFGVTTQMTPYPCYIYDIFVDSISQTLPLLMVLAWIFTVSMTVKDIVYEKEKRLKEFMRVMGLTNGIHWLAWFITSFVIIMAICLFLSIILKYGRIVSKIDLSVLLVFLCCFVLATITQCFLISVFFNKANLAAAAGGIIYFLLYLPHIVLTNFATVLKPYQVGLASLSSAVGFGYGCSLIASFELQGVGMNWKTFYEVPISANNGVTMNFLCLVLLFDSFLYMVLAWYLETIWPGEFGRGLSFLFPLQPSYWCGKVCATKYCVKKSSKKIIDKVISEELNSDPIIFEPIDISFANKIGIQIDNLHKIYPRGENHALKGLTLNFYENEITSFLG